METIYWLLGWITFSFAGVGLSHWLEVKKGLINTPNWLWLTMLFTIYLPWTLWAGCTFLLSIYSRQKRFNKSLR